MISQVWFLRGNVNGNAVFNTKGHTRPLVCCSRPIIGPSVFSKSEFHEGFANSALRSENTKPEISIPTYKVHQTVFPEPILGNHISESSCCQDCFLLLFTALHFLLWK